MEQEDKWKLLRMCIRCNKVRKHKPKRAKEPQLVIGGIDSPLFADSEIKHNSFSRLQTGHVRHEMMKLISED